MKKLGVYVATILVAGAVLAAAVLIAAPSVGQVATSAKGEGQPIDLDRFTEYAVRSEVYASDDSIIATLHGVENREPVSLDQIPDAVKGSILAVEDAEFYQHGGVNLRALTRAMVENVQAGGVRQGGSTITQQLVKNVLLNNERDIDRKIKEAALAVRLEDQMSKDEILESYLNTVYFGSGAYGVQAAAETYWGKNVGELNWADGAMLAAIISNPIAYDPTLHPEEAKRQRDVAVDRIVANGALSRDVGAFLKLVPVPVGRCTGVAFRPPECGEIVQPLPESYVADAVKNELLDLGNHQYDEALGTTADDRLSAVFGGGLQVRSTIDPVVQAAAQNAHDTTLPSGVAAQAAAEGVTTASVTVENGTGAIRAMIGGPPWSRENQYNIAITEPGRPTGSTFKTFVLLTALEQGDYPTDTVIGEQQCWKTPPGDPEPLYCPKGSGGTITSITQKSSNAAFVRLGQTVGLANVVDLAERLGVSSGFNPEALSMPLGVFNVTPLEMASAYSAVPNGGIRNPPYLVESIEDRFGNVVYEHAPDPSRAVSPATACYATEVLAANVAAGTGTRARLDGTDAAGKTGTTEKNADTWFVGFTSQLTTAVWMGIPGELRSMRAFGGSEQFGGLWPATIWHNLNQDYLDLTELEPAPFAPCPAPPRSGRPAAGAADPYGTLNGGRVPSTVSPVSGGGGGRGAGGGGGGGGADGGTTTTAGADAAAATTTPPASTPPANAGPGGGP